MQMHICMHACMCIAIRDIIENDEAGREFSHNSNYMKNWSSTKVYMKLSFLHLNSFDTL